MLDPLDSGTELPESAITPAYQVPLDVPKDTSPEQVMVAKPPAERLLDEQEPSSASEVEIIVLLESLSSLLKLPVEVPPLFCNVTEHDRVEPADTEDGHETLETTMSAGVLGWLTVTES